MPKIIKKFEHKPVVARRNTTFAQKYNWELILSGQNVQLDAGTDYERTGKDKNGKEFDRTDSFISTIKSNADYQNKTVSITKLDASGKAITDPDSTATVASIVVTAIPMTPEQIKVRDDRRAKLRASRAATQAAKEAAKKEGAGLIAEHRSGAMF
jgi:hypothetical protein